MAPPSFSGRERRRHSSSADDGEADDGEADDGGMQKKKGDRQSFTTALGYKNAAGASDRVVGEERRMRPLPPPKPLPFARRF